MMGTGFQDRSPLQAPLPVKVSEVVSNGDVEGNNSLGGKRKHYQPSRQRVGRGGKEEQRAPQVSAGLNRSWIITEPNIHITDLQGFELLLKEMHVQ